MKLEMANVMEADADSHVQAWKAKTFVDQIFPHSDTTRTTTPANAWWWPLMGGAKGNQKVALDG